MAETFNLASLLAPITMGMLLVAPLAALLGAVFLEPLFAAFDAAIAALCGIAATFASGSGPRVAHRWPTDPKSGPRVAHFTYRRSNFPRGRIMAL